MSAAEPMDAATRGENYAAHPDQFTGRQSRRLWHKEGRAGGGWPEPVYPDSPPAERPKGYATPRRADAIRGKRALRRFAEAHRTATP
jgi:hypothetical protein